MNNQSEVIPEQAILQEKIDSKPTQIEVKVNPEKIEQEDSKDINWKKWKESRQKEREESEARLKRAQEKEAEAEALKAAMEVLLNKPTQNNRSYDEPLDETEDERIDKKVQLAMAKAEQKRMDEVDRREKEDLPKRLAQNNPDFHQVCSSENLDYLEFHYPEVAQAFQHMPEGYKKWDNIYKAVKRFVPNTDTRRDVAKAEKNFNKPQSLSSPGVSTPPSGNPSPFLTEQKKAENWARMQKARNTME